MKLKRAPIAILVSLAAVSARADWRATGRFQYTDRTYNLSGFTGTVVLPIREADFQVYDIDTLSVLGQGATNADGEFDIQIVDAQRRRARAGLDDADADPQHARRR
jgi:hypothetical protein